MKDTAVLLMLAVAGFLLWKSISRAGATDDRLLEEARARGAAEQKASTGAATSIGNAVLDAGKAGLDYFKGLFG